ncbi:MAG TPA: adenylate/guanylate cyclase domain-containing protein [Candidatus Saccharimonadales bacterium]|nr:adenylate/guanylate cyclase domain-containing protein [Candidatus Saccharimonadales bacterium]
MFLRFDDISIRGKLTAMVAGAVAVLTTAVLVSVWLTAWREVRADVRGELLAARREFITTEGEHLHEQVLEGMALASDDDLLRFLGKRDGPAACAWLDNLLTGRDAPLNPEDSFDMAALVKLDGGTLAAAVNGRPPCGAMEKQWKFSTQSPPLVHPEITNWESEDGKLYELVQAPVIDGQDRRQGTLVLGFEISDSFARHVKEHTGQEAMVWHEEGNEYHLLGASDRSLREMLVENVSRGRIGPEIQVETNKGRYTIFDAAIEDHLDTIRNPHGLHLALMQSLDVKFQPFRRLEYRLAVLAFLSLVLGLVVGSFLSRPIANPLISLAGAAEVVARGELAEADHLLKRNAQRMDARDEIGVLGRSFLRMVQGLRERMAMAPFLSQATQEHITRNDQGLPVNQRTSMVILFADVRQFSSYSETRDPETVIQLLNEVLGLEVEAVRRRQGDIDKFVGDALVAWFSGEGRCARAVAAANEMVAALHARFNGAPGTVIGVGIHVGEVVVGSVGSSTRKDYTAIGSVVNMAARLCSKAQPGQILVSKAVAEELGPSVSLKPLTPIALKGFSEPAAVFEANLPVAET